MLRSGSVCRAGCSVKVLDKVERQRRPGGAAGGLTASRYAQHSFRVQ